MYLPCRADVAKYMLCMVAIEHITVKLAVYVYALPWSTQYIKLLLNYTKLKIYNNYRCTLCIGSRLLQVLDRKLQVHANAL